MQSLLQLVLITCGLLFAEIHMSVLSNYCYSDYVNFLSPIAIFGGLAVGNLVGLHPQIFKLSLRSQCWIVFFLQAITYLGLKYVPHYQVWLALPFIGYGVLMTYLFSKYSLKELIISLGISGIIVSLSYKWLLEIYADTSPLATLLFPVLAGILADRQNKIFHWIPHGVFIFIILGILNWDVHHPPSIIKKRFKDDEFSVVVSEKKVNPLFITELFKRQIGQYIFTINGSRFGLIPDYEETHSRLTTKQFNRPYDLPYLFTQPERVLVVGSAEGRNVISALANGVKDIWALDINPDVFELFRTSLPDVGHLIYFRPEVQIVVAEGRYFLEQCPRRFDLITLQGVQTGSAASTTSPVLIESFLFTREAVKAAWDCLTDEGLIMYDEYTGKGFNYLPQIIAQQAKDTLNLPEEQILLLSYSHSESDPTSRAGEIKNRSSVFISKKPLSVSDESKSLLAKNGVSIEAMNPLHHESLTDNNPHFRVKRSVLDQLSSISMVCLFLLLVLIYKTTPFLGAAESIWLSLTGIAYMMFVFGLSGPFSLWLGHPGRVTPVLYITLYAMSLVSGLWVLKSKKRTGALLTMFFSVSVTVWALLYHYWSTGLLNIPSMELRIILCIMIASLFAFTAEIPYILGLRVFENKTRSWANALEHVGNLAAIPLSIWIQVKWGSQALLLTSSVLFLVVGFILLTSSKKIAQ
ncbi:MAG: hypothetical protein K2Q26_07555 [Bdellovibrionales bacterium]|nr:hypothetical protein [Bdellovibrionales bacterium]